MSKQLSSNVWTTTERYIDQERWPSSGCHILGHFDEQSIILYQAYCKTIAESAVRCQSFVTESPQNGFSVTRMTWLKPNFLWMMYRSGWGTKHNQERILAIRVTRLGFETMLATATPTTKLPSESRNQFKNRLKQSLGRLQWDPDHLPNGERHPSRRALQIGIKGEVLDEFLHKWIVHIEDVTNFVHRQYQSALITQRYEALYIPKERIYPIQDKSLAESICLS